MSEKKTIYGRKKTSISPEVWVLVKNLLRKQWLPRDISQHIKMEKGLSVSGESIYQFIYRDHKAGALFISTSKD